MTDRITALGRALTARGYTASDAGTHVRVEAPAGSTATVSASSAPHSTFTLTEDLSARDSKRWSVWTAEPRSAVDVVWSEVSRFAERPTVAVPEPIATAPRRREPDFAHAYPLGPLVDPDFAISHDEAQRGRFRIVTRWHSLRDTGLVTDSAWAQAGPTLCWHVWGEASAWAFGAAKGWASLDGVKVSPEHPAAAHVRTILLHAAKGEALPSGIVALDLRDLSADIAHAVITALVERVRACEDTDERKGVICLCDDLAAAWVGRTVELDTRT